MNERFLTRKRLRDCVILLCAGSAFFFPVGTVHIVLAFLVLILGTLVHFIAKGILIRNRVLCTGGIYRIVRHPYYLANYLIDTGFCLMSGNDYLLLLYPFLFFWAYGPTLREEEMALARWHGDSSVEYILGTPGIFPDTFSVRYLKQLFDGFSFSRISRKEIARIVRFYGVSTILLLLHETSLYRLGDTLSAVRPDVSVFVLLTLATLLFGTDLVILRRGRRESH